MVYLTLLLVAVSIALSEGSGCVDKQYEATCGGSCTFTCADPMRQCVQKCIDGCKCPRRTPVLHNGKCIKKSDCPTQGCSGGKVWNVDGKRCTPTCEKQRPECPSERLPRCECPPSKPIWNPKIGECVRSNECPLSKCGSKSYSSATRICCGTTVNPLPEHPECCGEKAYNRLTHICCSGRLMQRRGTDEGCCGLAKFTYTTHACCRGRSLQVYRLRDELCCDGVVHDKPSGKTSACCDKRAYSTDSQICCDGRVDDSSRYICCADKRRARPVDGECCMDVAYSKRTHDCCRGTLISKAKNLCCKDVIYDSRQKMCCWDAVYDKRRYRGCCRTKTYDTRRNSCCKGKIVAKDVPCP